MSKDILRRPASDKKIEKSYSKFSEIYSFFYKFPSFLNKKKISMLDIKGGEKILEIGVGPGYDFIDIAKLVGEEGEVHGIDISKEMVDKTQRRVARKNLESRAEVIKGDARDLPYPDNSFDIVYASEVFSILREEEIKIVLEEVRRVLKENGRIAVYDSLKDQCEGSLTIKIYELFYKYFHLNNMFGTRPIYLKKSLSETGYKVINSRTFRFRSFSILPVKILIGTVQESD